MNPRSFTKMHGLGNDFIMLDCRKTPFQWQANEIKDAANRHTGIGFDQLLIIEAAKNADADFSYRIFNSDGHEVEQCGNGSRCFGKYLKDKNLFDFHRPVRVAVKHGVIEISNKGNDRYQVDMSIPNFTPFTTHQTSELHQIIHFETKDYDVGIVSMGNPHAVMQVADVDNADVEGFGAFLQHHILFPERVNAGFMEMIDAHHIRLRVFERGVGETMACGTGACAAAAIGIARGDLLSPVAVSLPGGELSIEWESKESSLKMTGPAATVFSGTL